MNATRPAAAFALLAALISVTAASAGPTQNLDCALDGRLYDTHFGRYGPRPTRVVSRDAKGLRLWLPAEPQGAKQTGLYSYFALAGDFEVAVDYEVLNLPATKTGYGAGFGLAVETRGADGEVSVRRVQLPREGSGLQVVRGRSIDGDMRYEPTFFPTQAKKGRLVLRREKAEVIVLTTDAPGAEVQELTRVPFTTATVRTVRLFADSGGSNTVVDARLTGLALRAEEITGGIPERDRERTPWWVFVVAALLAVGIGLGLWRMMTRRRGTQAA